MSQSCQLAAFIPPLGGTDIVGYTALTGHDDAKTFELLIKNRAIPASLLIP